MRALLPRRRNPWPHDMMLTIDTPHPLLDLLWIRQAWGLRPRGGDLPPGLMVTPEPVEPAARAAAPLSEWEAGWPEVWAACLSHAGTQQDDELFRRVRRTDLSADEHRALFLQLRGPTWRDKFGTAAYSGGHRAWENTTIVQQRETPRDVERSLLDAVIPAWKAGLTKIVEIPCRGTFTRRIGSNGLLVTTETRTNNQRYRQALNLFQ
ncbi:hypothetical protein HII28_13350 [Planctomonas sp. JC2975]|uniref:hypothetical protein n=1 Tax=Planctomonas sp. JC2975 TaxID=2729626 RepID=UPI00147465D3|nr:hypothetical protein [Planctomonas sp. JC2975]NNC12861.1 hypothetical protein [Planctomonas sp. JC2975]